MNIVDATCATCRQPFRACDLILRKGKRVCPASRKGA